MDTQAMSPTCHKMWCPLYNLFQQSWMRRLPHGACVTLDRHMFTIKVGVYQVNASYSGLHMVSTIKH